MSDLIDRQAAIDAIREWKAIENLYISGVYHQNIVEVNGLDNPIHPTEDNYNE